MRVFRVFKGRIILMVLILVLGFGVAAYSQQDAIIRKLHGVSRDVYYVDEPLEGKLEAEVRDVVLKGVFDFFLEPVDAKADTTWSAGVIPDLLGYRLNVERTVEKIMAAEAGEHLTPELDTVLALLTIEDFPGLPVYRGNPEKEQVAFMVNVAWGEEHIPEMLAVFLREGVRVTFFPVGRWAEKNPQSITEILRHGHELGSHGYDDRLVLKGLEEEAVSADLELSAKAIGTYTGESVAYFTPHKGEFDNATLQAATEMNMRVMMWSLDTADWMQPGVEKMLERTVGKIFNGAIILMHPTEETVAYLEKALPLIKESGLEVVTISTLLDPHRLQIPGEEER